MFTKMRGLLPDHEIRMLCVNHEMLSPYHATKIQKQSPSKGMSSYGYDITLGKTFKTFKDNRSLFNAYDVLRPGEITEDMFDTVEITLEDDAYILEGGEFCLAESEQYFKMPDNVTALVKDKSTYARMGISLFNTVIEPGWNGILTLEIVNHSNRPIALYPGRGIAQILFYGNEHCENPYGKEGKYQDAEGLEIPK